MNYKQILTYNYLRKEYSENKKTIMQISKEINCNVNTVHEYLKKFDLNRSYRESFDLRSKQHYNLKLFETLNPDSCYILGFFAADGSVVGNVKNTNYITFGVSEISLPVLEYISNKVGGRIRYYEKFYKGKKLNSYVLSYGSRYLVDLFETKYNFHRNKTYQIDFPNYIPDNLLHYFIRGFLDGDGSIYYSNCLCINFGCKDYKFLKSLANKINKLLNISSNVNGKKFFILNYYGKKAISVGNWIYQDLNSSFYLPYKYERFLEYSKQYN